MSDENNRLMAARPVYLVDADSGAIVANDAPLPVQLSGSTPAGDDVTGTGNDASVDLGVEVRFVDFYNGGDSTATLSDGTETRSIPAGAGRLCEFTTAAQTFAVTADGAWIATPMV